MRQLILVLFATTALAQAASVPQQKLSEAQQAIAAGDCVRALAALREVIAVDPQNFAAHLFSANCDVKQKDYRAAAGEFQRALEIRPDAAPGVLGLIQAYALSGDKAHRDAEIERLRALIRAGKIPMFVRFVREQFSAGNNNVVVNEYPTVTLWRSRYAFEVFDKQQKLIERIQLVSRDADQLREGARQFTLIASGITPPTETTLRVYPRGEPSYAQVVSDVKAILAGRTLSNLKYTLAKAPAVVVPMPITINDAADPRLQLQPGQVAIEYIAHSCFRVHTSKGTRLLIDPYASRVWLGYDFPARLAADAVLITHPHYDHDADTLMGGQPAPWAADVRVMRDAGSYKVADVTITGIAGKHADPYGKEFGQKNTIWLLDVDGLRIAHLGDNGPLTDANVQALGRVDVLMIPIDAKHHILKDHEIEAILKAVNPRVVIPMHYRIPDLEPSPDSPQDLGEIGPWLAGQPNVVQLEKNIATFSAGTLPATQTIVVFPHSPNVTR